MNDYLWDRSGSPDPEVERLERVLGMLRHRNGAVAAPVVSATRRRWLPVAAAAAVIGAAIALQWPWAGTPESTPWIVTAIEAPADASLNQGSALRTGQSIRTGRATNVTLEAEGFGRIELKPDSELQVLASRQGRQSLSLPRGTIHALIWAPPRRFVVNTPSAKAIDLGCEYTLTVDQRGDGLVRVQTGWVAFQHEDRESFIPAGAACATTKRHGPGTPYFEDASEAFRRSLSGFDQTAGRDDLDTVLQEARRRDAVTVWHLLRRVPASERGAVFDRFAELVEVPAGVTREAIVAGDESMLDECWNALGLESAEWWREWKRDWRQ
ncbi:MAG TPA: FecR domain-containing protein [Bryobacteraceae bacterium]|nr:FecR domain-containing protein [Bryobacteraceae bacterium]